MGRPRPTLKDRGLKPLLDIVETSEVKHSDSQTVPFEVFDPFELVELVKGQRSQTPGQCG